MGVKDRSVRCGVWDRPNPCYNEERIGLGGAV